MGAAIMDTPALPAMFQFDRFRLRPGGGGLLRQDTAGAWRPVSIGSRALAVLGVLIEQRGTLMSKDKIMRAVWPGTAVEEHNLTVQISMLRRLLDEDHPSESCIQTVTGRGYRFRRPTMALCPDGDPFLESMHSLRRPPPHSRPRLSLVVLPLKYLGDEPGGVAMAETITDELTAVLSGWSFALVIAGGSTGTRELDPLKAGKALGADYVVHAGIRRTLHQTRVNIGLIDVETAAHLWAEQFDADHKAIADIHDEITGRLARSLARKLIEVVNSRLGALQPGDWTTYDHDIRSRAMAMQASSLTHKQAERSPPPRLSVIVLPIFTADGTPYLTRLAVSLREGVTVDLAQLWFAQVSARGAVLAFRDQPVDVQMVGRALDVRYVLDSSLRRHDDRLRVTAWLMSGETGEVLGLDEIEVTTTDNTEMQDEVRGWMANFAGKQMTIAESTCSIKQRPDNPDAFDLLLQARALFYQRSSATRSDAARTLYERALQLDPLSYRAMADLAAVISEQYAVLRRPVTREDFTRADQLMSAAEALAPTDNAVLYSRAYLLRQEQR